MKKFHRHFLNRWVLHGIMIAFATLLYMHDARTNVGCASGKDTPCDPEYMDALEARAWMEAQREISQNQNLIFKPDSVLEYTCFDRFLNTVARNDGYAQDDRIFSETTRWGPISGFNATSTDTALTTMVLTAVVSYLAANTTNAYLDERTGISYTPQTTVAGGGYSCDQMGRVWNEARCMEFMDEAGTDGFFDFPHYAGTDPRQVRPTSFVCNPPGGTSMDGLTRTSAYTGALQAAFNADQALFTMAADNAPVLDGGPYQEDDVVTYLQAILPGTCADSLIILTGVTVDRPDIGSPFPERVCTMPGCSAPPSATGACQ